MKYAIPCIRKIGYAQCSRNIFTSTEANLWQSNVNGSAIDTYFIILTLLLLTWPLGSK